MNGIGVSAVTAYTAHREWASRPPDERYASVHALYDAARARRLRTEERTIETVALRTEAVASDALALRDTSGRQAALTNWSFEQLAGIAAAPPKYLRTLPAAIASDAINYGLRRQRREQQQLLVDRDEPWTVHAVTSPRYARVHHDELAGRVLDLMAQHPAWSLPLGYKDGVFGAERVPSGAYLGDRDMFLFLVDGNRDLDDPTDASHAGLFRGFILRNSDVGAAALTLDVFLFRAVCGNHIIWGFQHVVGFRRRHVGASIQEAWTTSLESVRTALDADAAHDRLVLLRATSQELGPTRDAVVDDGRAATRAVAEAGRRGVHAGGNVRDESPFGLGLRARAHASESAHALAGWPVHSRSRGQPPPDHGPLDPVIRRSGTAPRLLPRTTGVGTRHVLHPPLATAVAQVAAFAPRAGRSAGGVCHARRIHPPTKSRAHSTRPGRLSASRSSTGDNTTATRSFRNSRTARTASRGRVGSLNVLLEELHVSDEFDRARRSHLPPARQPVPTAGRHRAAAATQLVALTTSLARARDIGLSVGRPGSRPQHLRLRLRHTPSRQTRAPLQGHARTEGVCHVE